ncbi:3-oxoacyl-[acyl-carrier protein] reductase, partial [Virgibacillus chiguensis]
ERLLLVLEQFQDHGERFFDVLKRFPTCGSDFLMIGICSLNLFFQIDILTIQVIINGEGWLMMGQQIKGKTAYITGAGSGIGRATALALAKEGVHVGFIARTETKLEAVAREVETYGVNTSYAVANIAKLEEVEEAVAKLETSLGSADILINNAGIGAYGDFLEMDPETWKQTIEVNVFGTYHVTRAVLPHMLKKNQGDIIMISSSNGLKGTAGSTSYSASKFAIQGMSEALMQEVRRNNIRVFTLNPSLVATELAFGEKLAEKNDDKYMQPEDLAEYMVAQLKLHPRMFIKQSLQWATNPF